ncbi:MAG TPA: Uma2 family endonuclease [Thermoanaerobaculia bacterium]|jgi:Uma2 family endonuclease|nr:Uma2 family endonuclease [Thermoanaerobaculia bacterium]
MTVAPSPSKKWTYQDYLLLPDDEGQRYEIVEGELFLNAAPLLRHQRISGNLFLIIAPYVRARRCGELFYAPVDVVLSNIDVVQPDLLYITEEHAAVMTNKNVQGTPDFVIEVLSQETGRRDEVLKLRRYQEFGVAEYWIVDPPRNRVRVYLRKNDRLELVNDAGLGDTLTSAFFPNLPIPVNDVFAEW